MEWLNAFSVANELGVGVGTQRELIPLLAADYRS